MRRFRGRATATRAGEKAQRERGEREEAERAGALSSALRPSLWLGSGAGGNRRR
jgi:hypothetical protein